MRFIDLFAGLGGFHKALHELGHKCVFASELNQPLREIYKANWGIEPKGDIRKVVKSSIDLIPPHDILCAGFPCQPFSKAGNQRGLMDEERGTLFDDIVKILKHRRPKYFILENVPHLAKHNDEQTWTYMQNKLKRLGYEVDHRNYSPHHFGIPQHRLRIFIVGSLNGLSHFSFDEVDKQKRKVVDIHSFLNGYSNSVRKLPKSNIECLELWQEFIDSIPEDVPMPGFPIWSMEFGATYPYENTNPHKLSEKELGQYKGNFGISLKGLSKEEQLKLLPSYARTKTKFPDWKVKYIRFNREFYQQNIKQLRAAVSKLATYEFQSWQKLEWNVGREKGNIFDYIIQFRASGVRIKKVDFFPSLVCTKTQIPIIGWQKRYLTKTEGLKLQSLTGIELPEQENAAFRALGNAVNAKIVRLIAEQLIKETHKNGNHKNGNHKNGQHIKTKKVLHEAE
ncbi:MAG: DNA (cytosine-5-)-methyltransferase [Flammeovirgaceae bacterium]|nr:MAG: DNA (cytosine-5-)-methyltransferase [Flammeovirgaceae bacterium]